MDKLWRRSWNASWNAAPSVPAPAQRSGPRVRKCLVSWPEELRPPWGGRPPCATSGSQPEAAQKEGWAQTGPWGGGDRFLSTPSAPPTSWAPDAGTCHTRTHTLLHLEGSSPGEDCSAFRTQLWPSSWIQLSLKPPTHDAVPPHFPPAVSQPRPPLLHRGRPTPLCVLHRTVAAPAAALGGAHSWQPVFAGLGDECLRYGCLSERPWDQRGSFSFLGHGIRMDSALNHRGPPSHHQSPVSAQPGVVRRGLQSQQACLLHHPQALSQLLEPWFPPSSSGQNSIPPEEGCPSEALHRN